MENFKWVIVGCGNSKPGKGGAHSIGYCHAAAISRIPGLRLAGVADCSEPNLKDFTAAFPEVPGYADYKPMFAEIKPDVISVCTWARDREIHVIDAIRSGAKAVLIEKPIALTVEAAERFLNGFAELVMEKYPGDNSVFRLMSPETDGVFTLATDENFHHGDTDPVLYMERGMSDIRESLLTGKKTELEAENALFGIRIINAVHRSAETGRTVKFETSGSNVT